MKVRQYFIHSTPIRLSVFQAIRGNRFYPLRHAGWAWKAGVAVAPLPIRKPYQIVDLKK